MAGIAADGALDLHPALATPGRGAEALGTLKGPVAGLGADRAELLLLEGSVQQRQLAELGLLVHVLLVVDDDQHVLDELGGLVELGDIVARN